MKIDPKLFNDDPKFEVDRNLFDTLLEGSLARIAAKNKNVAPPADENIFDTIFGGKKDAE